MSVRAGVLPRTAGLAAWRSWVRRHQLLLGLAGYALLAGFRYLPALQGSGLLVGGPWDNEQHAWELGWWAYAITHGMDPLTTTYIGSAHGVVNLMWNNSTPLLALLALPATLLLGVVKSFDLLVAFAMFASAGSAFLCLRAFSDRPLSAWIGGLLFGLSPLAVAGAQSGKLPWISLFLVPPMLLLFHRLLIVRRGRPWLLGPLLGLVIAGQLLISEELLCDAALLGALMALLLGLSHRQQVLEAVRFALPALALALATVAATAGYPLLVQFLGPARVHGNVIPVERLTSDLAGFLVPTSHQLVTVGPTVFPSLTAFQTNLGIAESYLGVPLLALMLYAGIRYRGDAVLRWALVLAGLAMLLSLGPHLTVMGHTTRVPLPWALIRHLPLLGLAAPQRVMVFAYLGVALACARLPQLGWGPSSSGLQLGLACICALTLLPSGAVLGRLAVPSFFTGPGVDQIRPGSVAMVAPVPGNAGHGAASLAPAMVWQADARFRFRLLWGNLIQASRTDQATIVPNSALFRALRSAQEGQQTKWTTSQIEGWRRELLASGSRYALVGLSSRHSPVVQLLTRVLGRTPRFDAGVAIWAIPQGPVRLGRPRPR